MKVWRDLQQLPSFKNSIITIGTFDGVHKGHHKLIKRITELATQIGGESVLITFHPHPRLVIQPETSGLQLLNTTDEKISLLSTCGVDHLVIVPFSREFSNLSAEAYVRDFLVKCFHPHTIVIGYDHHFGQNRSGNLSLLRQLQPNHHYALEEISKEMLDDIDISSTKIRHSLLQGDVALANSLLGYPYFMSGIVVKGLQNGRKLGFPTANVEVNDTSKLIPANGVYAVRVRWKNEMFQGACNIGTRPTLNGLQRTIETYLFSFGGDIYGEYLQVELIAKLRDEKKFDSLDDLKNAIATDVENSKQLLNTYR